jgi:two-component system, OmpR family, sensor histidine kinase BaeS
MKISLPFPRTGTPQHAARSARSAKRWILRILSLADAGEISLNRRMVDPSALLERTALAYFVQAEQQGLTLRVEAPENLPSVFVDTDRLAQILNNLVSNALRHTAQGEIVLSAAAHVDQLTLGVRDTGTGIDPTDLPNVFERLYRADKSRNRSGNQSSGLGLAITKALVEAHGGTISVASTVGQGSVFTISLPIAVQEPAKNVVMAFDGRREGLV